MPPLPDKKTPQNNTSNMPKLPSKPEEETLTEEPTVTSFEQMFKNKQNGTTNTVTPPSGTKPAQTKTPPPPAQQQKTTKTVPPSKNTEKQQNQPVSNTPKIAYVEDIPDDVFGGKPKEKYTETDFDDSDNVDVKTRDITSNDYFDLDDLLKFTVEKKATDLHLTANTPPIYRHLGEITPIPGYPPLTPQEVGELIYSILSPTAREAFERDQELNISYSIRHVGRFRVNIYQQRGTISAAIRLIPSIIPTFESLNLPAAIADFANYPRGLVLITGPTGSGKSTTLAALIDQINNNKKRHILTIEDPIEFVHKNKKCIINQREVGNDTQSFQDALRNALRQDPDVILLGEMRDLETIRSALTAAETGHLVFATLHTQSVSETMARIIDVFPEGSKDQVRAQLAATIQGIACQSLIKKLDGQGMVAGVEILKATPAIRSLIRKGADEQIVTILETSKKTGMQTLDAHLVELVKTNTISVESAFEKATIIDNLVRGLGGKDGVEKTKRQQARLGGVEMK